MAHDSSQNGFRGRGSREAKNKLGWERKTTRRREGWLVPSQPDLGEGVDTSENKEGSLPSALGRGEGKNAKGCSFGSPESQGEGKSWCFDVMNYGKGGRGAG